MGGKHSSIDVKTFEPYHTKAVNIKLIPVAPIFFADVLFARTLCARPIVTK